MARRTMSRSWLQRSKAKRTWKWKKVNPKQLRIITWRIAVRSGDNAKKYVESLDQLYIDYFKSYWGKDWYSHIRNLPFRKKWENYPGETEKDKKRARWRSFWGVYSKLISRLQGKRFNRRLIRAYKKAKFQSSTKYKAPSRKRIDKIITNSYQKYQSVKPEGNPFFKRLSYIDKIKRLKKRLGAKTRDISKMSPNQRKLYLKRINPKRKDYAAEAKAALKRRRA